MLAIMGEKLVKKKHFNCKMPKLKGWGTQPIMLPKRAIHLTVFFMIRQDKTRQTNPLTIEKQNKA